MRRAPVRNDMWLQKRFSTHYYEKMLTMRSFDDKRPLLQIFHGLFHCCILICDYSFFYLMIFFLFLGELSDWKKTKSASSCSQLVEWAQPLRGPTAPGGPRGPLSPRTSSVALPALLLRAVYPETTGGGMVRDLMYPKLQANLWAPAMNVAMKTMW